MKHTIAKLVVVLNVVFCLFACGGGGSDTTQTTSPPPAAEDTPTTPVDQPDPDIEDEVNPDPNTDITPDTPTPDPDIEDEVTPDPVEPAEPEVPDEDNDGNTPETPPSEEPTPEPEIPTEPTPEPEQPMPPESTSLIYGIHAAKHTGYYYQVIDSELDVCDILSAIYDALVSNNIAEFSNWINLDVSAPALDASQLDTLVYKQTEVLGKTYSLNLRLKNIVINNVSMYILEQNGAFVEKIFVEVDYQIGNIQSTVGHFFSSQAISSEQTVVVEQAQTQPSEITHCVDENNGYTCSLAFSYLQASESRLQSIFNQFCSAYDELNEMMFAYQGFDAGSSEVTQHPAENVEYYLPIERQGDVTIYGLSYFMTLDQIRFSYDSYENSLVNTYISGTIAGNSFKVYCNAQ